jgi:hypothetical protein
MARPFTRRQALQNARFLEALAETGNARLSARRLGFNRSTFTKRRARDAAFAARWEAALAVAHARFHLSGGTRAPEILPGRGRGPARSAVEGAQRPPRAPPSLRTRGGEPAIVRTQSGRLQLRLAPPGRMTRAAEQAFFRALSATANVRLSAAAAGFAHSSFYARARESRAFAKEMRAALRIGYDRLECALIERAVYDEDDLAGDEADWRDHVGDNPLPPLRPDEALQLLWHHRRTCRLGWETRAAPHRVATNAEVRRALTIRLRQMGWHPDDG